MCLGIQRDRETSVEISEAYTEQSDQAAMAALVSAIEQNTDLSPEERTALAVRLQ